MAVILSDTYLGRCGIFIHSELAPSKLATCFKGDHSRNRICSFGSIIVTIAFLGLIAHTHINISNVCALAFVTGLNCEIISQLSFPDLYSMCFKVSN